MYVVFGDVEFECRPVIGLRSDFDAAVELCQDDRNAHNGYRFDRYYVEQWPVDGSATESERSWEVTNEGKVTELLF